jgi:hypothetical protein
MKAGGFYGAHNVVEVKIGKEWVVLDPTYNLRFIRPDGKLACFADVKNDWPFYSKQVPADYNLAYHYEDARYTNWSKIPVVSPAAKAMLTLVIGPERTNAFSMRTILMNTYTAYLYLLIALYIPLFLVTIKGLVKTKIFPSPEIPVTLSNVVKYIKLRAQNTSYTP